MRASYVQPKLATRLALRDALEGLQNPPKLEGWLFPGAIKSVFRPGALPVSLNGDGELRVILALVYVKENESPMSIPLVVEVVKDRLRLFFRQPITAQIFTGLCWWRDPTLRYRPEAFNMYNLKYRTWEHLPSSPEPPERWIDNSVYLPLPLRHIPIFKPASLVTTPYPEGFSLGCKRITAVCSMKVSFIPHIQFLWPRGLKNLPSYVKVKWTVGSDDDGIVATCPGFSEEGNEMWEVDPEREDEDAAAAAAA
ncbi:uncharacterized protein B0H18DRAFT_1130469 [Fomitopsis serialis]|uniref:uncharacterized protein n=1 Tax=Fomitopsis serialis TaxID=139415 RepID=UPI0020072BC6|nr:uncharacterized protein B0H18DRAFT_1130469 [Neoantrodia serialis]KAH9910259.1 hypothetical protein B0H18DRAFT_1130469 [Neoantrodia serialis]